MLDVQNVFWESISTYSCPPLGNCQFMADFAYENIRQSPVNLASTEGVLERLPSLLPCVGWM